MSLRLVAALVAVLQFTSAPAALAADLYGGPPDDDTRYSDIYRHPPGGDDPRYPPYGKHDDDDDEDEGPRYAERYDRGEYLAPMPYPPSVVEGPVWGRYDGPGCVPGHEIRRELVRDGWRGFRDAELRGRSALVTARRPNGEFYRLKVNRCTGEIVRARPLDDGGDSYAWRRRGPLRTY